MRKLIVETLPLLTVLLITLAFSYTHGYYKVINIAIYYYFDTTEMLFGFIPLLSDIATYLNVILFAIIMFIARYHTDNSDTESAVASL